MTDFNPRKLSSLHRGCAISSVQDETTTRVMVKWPSAPNGKFTMDSVGSFRTKGGWFDYETTYFHCYPFSAFGQTYDECLENSLGLKKKTRGNAQLKVHLQSHCEGRFLLP